MTTVCITFNSRYNWNAVIWMEDSLTIFPRQKHNSAHSTWTKVSEAIALFLKWQISEEHSPYYWQDRLSNFLVIILFVNWQIRAYQKSGTWDPQHLRVGPPQPRTCKSKMSRWDPEPGAPKVGHGIWDPKIFKWNWGLPIFYSFNCLFYT